MISQIETSESGPPKSKSQMKKELRRKRYLEHRGERRKIEKERRKLSRQERARERENSGQVDDKTLTRVRKPTLMTDSSNQFRIVIDMDFDDYMTDAEVGKAVQQLGRIYAINRRSDNPCQLYISSLKGRIRDRCAVTNTGYEKWDVNVSDKNYMDLFDCDNMNNDSKLRNFIYLSGDSENTLPDTGDLLQDKSKIFVIGGLVDHNRHKNLCYNRALEKKIPTAKLPIKQHINLCQRHILSTVTVFEIILSVLGDHKSWPDALVAGIPKRKIQQATDNYNAYLSNQQS